MDILKTTQAKRWYTSDLHFSDSRFDIFVRPFKNLDEQHETLIKNWNETVGIDDEVYIVGDFSVTDEGLKYADQLNGKKILIMGNYDEPRCKELLVSKFDSIIPRNIIVKIQGEDFFVNHYPEKCISTMKNITGHVHGTWRVQKNMVNVSVEAWNYKPVSEEQIMQCFNAIENHYDDNVFAGTLSANLKMKVLYAGDSLKSIHGPSVFLAGPTPRDSNTKSWRPDFIKELKEHGFKGTIMSPENEIFTDGYDYDKQVEWEDEGLTKASLIVFWIPRELKSMPGFTTNIEFGMYLNSGKIVLGYPVEAPKMNYLHYKAEKYNIPIFNDTKSVCKHVIDILHPND